MLRATKSMFGYFTLNCVRNTRRTLVNVPTVKIISADDEENMKISFRYGITSDNQNMLTFKAAKEQQIQEVLTRIKMTIDILQKREEIRQTIVDKYCGPSEAEVKIPQIEVELVNSDQQLDNKAKNIDAWTNGNHLKIGETVYEVRHNMPCVTQLKLPDYILSGCVIRPHFFLECASHVDSTFIWFRSIETNLSGEDEDVWQKVGEGFFYLTSDEDVGKSIKLVCIPKLGKQEGVSVSAVSPGLVEAAPHCLAFEERHNFTKDIVDSDCVRCVSFNVLANMYVEPRKFPYCTKKARDIYYRKQLMIRELLGYNSDIICLQEVTERLFEFDLIPVLEKIGFSGFFVKKGGRRHEGVALFYRKSKFKMIEQQGVYLKEIVKDKEIFNDLLTKVSGNFKDMSKLLLQDTALQLMLLEYVDQPKQLLVANTHLYSNKDTPEVRLIQAALCTCYVEHTLKMKKTAETPGLLFCGDFNSLPDSAAFEYITKGSFECCSSWKNNTNGSAMDSEIRHGLSLSSACGTPTYTNYTQEFHGCLDYIFYTDDTFSVKDIVPMPSHKSVIEQVALPSEYFSSDHIALVCTLQWKEWPSN